MYLSKGTQLAQELGSLNSRYGPMTESQVLQEGQGFLSRMSAVKLGTKSAGVWDAFPPDERQPIDES